MRDTIENISLLQKQLNDLQLENQVLKNILDQSGISYMQALKRLRTPETVTAYDPDQGARIIHPEVITPKMANEFYSWLLGQAGCICQKVSEESDGRSRVLSAMSQFLDKCMSKEAWTKNQL